MNKTEQWVTSVSNGTHKAEIARASGIPHPTLTRQMQADALTIENVLKIARAYKASIPDALIEHGVVTAEELSEMTIVGTLKDATDVQLLDELARRIERRDEADDGLLPGERVGMPARYHDPEYDAEAAQNAFEASDIARSAGEQG